MSNVTKLFEVEPSIRPAVFGGTVEKSSTTSWLPSPVQPRVPAEGQTDSQGIDENSGSSDRPSTDSLRGETLEMLKKATIGGDAAGLGATGDSLDSNRPLSVEEQLELARQEGITLGQKLTLEKMHQEGSTHTERTAQAIQALHSASAQLTQTYRWEAVELATRIAKAVLGASISMDPTMIHRSVEHVLSTVPRCRELVIRCHPEDKAELETHVPDLQQHQGQLVTVHISADTSIERGGLIVDFGQGSLDTQPSVSVDVLREAIEREVLETQHVASSPSNDLQAEEPKAPQTAEPNEPMPADEAGQPNPVNVDEPIEHATEETLDDSNNTDDETGIE